MNDCKFTYIIIIITDKYIIIANYLAVISLNGEES